MKISRFRLILSGFIFALFLTNSFADNKYESINITSNVEGATIYIDGVEIGKTPIYSHQVFKETDFIIKASANKKYYPDDISKMIHVKKGFHPTIYFEFKKGDGTIIFKGEDAHLYINNKYITTLEEHNRKITHRAGDNLKIEISTRDKRFTTQKNIYAGETIELPYILEKVNLDEELYTLTYDDLMWQDNPEAKTKNLNYEDAQHYCDKLELAGYTNWEIPSTQQLKTLYEIKEKLYNGIGAKAYWSSNQDLNSSHIWKYADALNFENGKVERKVQSFFDGNIRCVRVIE